MLEFGLVFAVYAVSYLKFFVDPSYIEQKLSAEFQARQQAGLPTNSITASEEAALLYVSELRRQKEHNLASGRPCFKPSRFYQPFYACVEGTGYEAEVQVKTIEVPNPPSVQAPQDDPFDDEEEDYEESDEDTRRYEEQLIRQTKGGHIGTSSQAPPRPLPVAPPPPQVQVQALPVKVQPPSKPIIDVAPLSLRVSPPTPEEYGLGSMDDIMGDPFMDEECEEAMTGRQSRTGGGMGYMDSAVL
ncbi:hypothetical protein TWF281_006177 [Arthrobotrys megalospora]